MPTWRAICWRGPCLDRYDLAVGRDTDGRRDGLGAATGAAQAEVFRKTFLRSLGDRGRRGVRLVIADDQKGLRAAASITRS